MLFLLVTYDGMTGDKIIGKRFPQNLHLNHTYIHAGLSAQATLNGKNIAAYKFGDQETAKKTNQLARTSGRTQLTGKLKNALIEEYGARCNLYGEQFPARLLQPDHRIPYEIGGDSTDMSNTDSFMLLSPSASRDKSWACEHCTNWTEKEISMYQTCYYTYPEKYQHIAGKKEKR